MSNKDLPQECREVAKSYGAIDLQRICAKIAGDEGRHERAYQSFCTEILKRDPDGLLAPECSHGFHYGE